LALVPLVPLVPELRLGLEVGLVLAVALVHAAAVIRTAAAAAPLASPVRTRCLAGIARIAASAYSSLNSLIESDNYDIGKTSEC